MSPLMDKVKTVNSSLRTLIFLGLAGGAGYGGYVGYENYVKPNIEAQQAIEKLEKLEVELHQTSVALKQTLVENDKLQTSMKLLKVDRRLANIEVVKTGKNEQGEPTMTVRFSELNQDGSVIGAVKEFELRGRLFYIDCWLVKFEDKYVEQADLLRSASLCVFKSIFGEIDGPMGSQQLDVQTTDAPGVYKDNRKSAFEKKIWDDFWNVSNNPELQRELGIRASHGEAIYILGEAGQTYQVSIRASGATSLEPIEKRSNE